jgi:hypothetical protein
MQEIVELKIDETKAVVGGAHAAIRARGGGVVGEIERFLEGLLHHRRQKQAAQ